MLGASLSACGGRSPDAKGDEPRPPPKSESPSADAEDSSAPVPLRGRIELRPLADDSEIAHRIAKGPVPDAVRARLLPRPRVDTGAEEAVFEADEIGTLHEWARTLEHDLPPGYRVAYEKTEPVGQPTLTQPMHKGWRLHLIRTDDGFQIHDATGRVRRSKYGGAPEMMVELTEADGKRLDELSGRMVGRKIAIMLDHQVLSAPQMNERISGGKFVVTLGHGSQDARDLVAKLAKIPVSEVVLPPADD